ncbi:sulfoacetaldehyde acetyltransferase [Thioalkalivibrio sp. HK1]|uniref:sulfoacetaldehyde acetyltransferase n=1 Tax=Thioalkalivibrio sp. HK1 TaxID=1469245 RepID=UPI001E54272A|nr:sulfoacetaldehyde acetyltransferase [Thioalkalivibrio sp. HK1]
MTSQEAFVETLRINGVKVAFGIVGSAFMPGLDIFARAGIRFVDVAHEQGAAHMADGYCRAGGEIAVCIAQNGPGITNFVTAVAAAYWNHTPMIVITPETGAKTQGLGGFQETRQLPYFEEITCHQETLAHPSRIVESLSRCFQRARQHSAPVQFNIPRDYFCQIIDVEIPQPILPGRQPGDTEIVARAADLLRQAKFPMIVAGAGVVLGDAVDECRRLAECLEAPVANSYLHNDSFPASHPLAVGPLGYQGWESAMTLIKDADVILALGTRLNPFSTLPQHNIDYWTGKARIIQVDANPDMLGLAKPIDIGICGDTRAVALQLVDALEGHSPGEAGERRRNAIATAKSAWLQKLAGWDHEEDDAGSQWNAKAQAAAPNRMAPRQALRAIQDGLPPDAMVSTDIGNICAMANSYLPFEQPRSFLAPGMFGNCGYAFPAIMGAKLACPNRPAVALVGDGAFGISLNELPTCDRMQIPVTIVVFRNEQWGAEKKNDILWFDERFVGTELGDDFSYAEVAKAFGLEGVRVESMEALSEAMRASCAAQGEGRTTLIEVVVNKELGAPFRRDAMQDQRCLLPRYAELTVSR